MNIFQHSTKKPLDIELTPLINIVFLILIFFLLAGSLKSGGLIDPVTAVSGDAQTIASSVRVVTMLSNGELMLDNTAIGSEQLIEQLKIAASDQLTVAIKPDANLAASELVDLMQLLKQVGLSSVQLLSVVDSGKR